MFLPANVRNIFECAKEKGDFFEAIHVSDA